MKDAAFGVFHGKKPEFKLFPCNEKPIGFWYILWYLHCFLLKGHLGGHAYHAPNNIVFCKNVVIILFKGIK